MTDLITYIGEGKGTIAHVEKVISGESWEKILVIASPEHKKESPKDERIEIVEIDSQKMLPEMIEQIKKELKNKVKIMDTAVNIISGTGKEHMALISALLQLGIGIRFIALTKEGVREI